MPRNQQPPAPDADAPETPEMDAPSSRSSSRPTTRRAAATDTASIGSVDGEIRTTQNGVGIDPAPEQIIVGPRNVSDPDGEVASTAGIYDDGTGSRRKVARGDVIPDGWTRVADVDYRERAAKTPTVEDLAAARASDG